MKPQRYFLILLILAPAFLPVFSQTTTLSRTPWNGDWMNQSKDQMVHGENYKGYPGPMVKMFYSLGQGIQNPGIDFELLTLVQRDAPRWYGNCNGWSSAAIQYDEPVALVVNGVKLFAGEVKALLSATWKNHVLLRVDDGNGIGMSPRSFERILDEFIGNNQPIIFDVAIGEESWNYPVSGFERHSRDAGEWIEVETVVSYTTTLTLAQAEVERDRVLLWDVGYTYRKHKVTGDYEWTGNSVSERPHRAWYPTDPYISGRWDNVANRSFNANYFQQLAQMAARENASHDLFEPNNDNSRAAAFAQNMVLASLHPGDLDWYHLDLSPGETLAFDLAVYDGPEIDIRIFAGDNSLVLEKLAQKTVNVDLGPTNGGRFLVQVSRPAAPEGVAVSATPIFYKMIQGEHRSWYRIPQTNGLLSNSSLTLINPDPEESTFNSEVSEVLPASGSRAVLQPEDGSLFRSPKRGVWAFEAKSPNLSWKSYYRKHPLQMPYRIPHLTFRNGWQTQLQVISSNLDDVWARVYSANGAELQSVKVSQEVLNGRLPFSGVLSQSTRENGAWFELETSVHNQLSGYVNFVHSSGISAPYNIEGSPRHGEMLVPHLLNTENGWIGLSLLNASGVYNEVLFRVTDSDGKVVKEGMIPLEPGARFLGTPQSISGLSSFAKNANLYFSSQYELETLAIRREYEKNRTFAYHISSSILDAQQYSWITVSNNPAEQILRFDNALSSSSNWVWIQAYAQDGSWQGEFRVTGKAVRKFQMVTTTMAEMLAEAGLKDAQKPIASFSITGQFPLLVSELIHPEGSSTATFIRPVQVYNDP